MPSAHVQKFYTSELALERQFHERGAKLRFSAKGAKASAAWQKRARAVFAKVLGLQHFKRVPPRPVRVDSVKLDGAVREEWRIQTERDVWMPYYLFVPNGGTEKRPLVLAPHGHGSGGKLAVAGRRDIPQIVAAIERYNYEYAPQLARAGFITACPDARGFGERREPSKQHDREHPEQLTASSCHELLLAGAPLGLTVQGMWTWDLMRLLDHLEKDPRVDAQRIGCAGLSGGGLQTLNLAALDTRVKAAVVSGYFYGFRESLQVMNGNCMCNLVPGLWEHFDAGDIGAMVAPRGLLIETGEKDPLNGASKLKNVTSQTAITRKAFAQFGAAAQFEHVVFSGAHRWDGARAVEFLREQLGLR